MLENVQFKTTRPECRVSIQLRATSPAVKCWASGGYSLGVVGVVCLVLFVLVWCFCFVLCVFVCVGVVVFVWFSCCVQRCQCSRMSVLLACPACSLHLVCDGPSQPVRCRLWSSCHGCPKRMGWWHLGQVGWAPRAMRASHSCLSFWCWCPYPRWVVVPLAAFAMRLCSLQYRSLGWTSFGHRVNAQTLRLMVGITCLGWCSVHELHMRRAACRAVALRLS